ncbi:hypothetical protein LOC67_14625 [Stieleria sp. JC731]|uniref:hypothetical protein n=1 Tax=Pirellulaceae TaxID=2691357 RepID=UPI001E37B4E9|nr:hypothetical protein [Stieleria sp. JC731]MCC9601792.1 hypothetical protein [Stieleria sp. JC731]
MSTKPCQPRILFVDDNVRSIGGHYLELASLLAEGASSLGYQAELASHRNLGGLVASGEQDSRLSAFKLHPVFSVRRMENWSLGIDGPSNCKRDLSGRPVGTTTNRLRQRMSDLLCRPTRRPTAMLEAWSDNFLKALRDFKPSEHDIVVVNTGGDFQLTALANAVKRFSVGNPLQSLRMHVIFHFAVYDDRPDRRANLFGEQINEAIEGIHEAGPHRIRLHATTEPLREQMRAVGVVASDVPYPTREPISVKSYVAANVSKQTDQRPIKLLLAGLPRAEKGRDQIKSMLSGIELDHMRSGQFSVSMQCDPNRWQRVIPDSMADLYQQAVQGLATGLDNDAPLEIKHGNLDNLQYHQWLDSADIGLFLYDPSRYVARCSGVLLETMVRGAAAIVPDRCWLADQVRQVESELGGNKIGWIYQSIEQIPELLSQVQTEFAEVRANCVRVAGYLAERHSGKNTLLEMGLRPASSMGSSQAA